MAGSKDNNKASADSSDDLDSILNKVETSSDEIDDDAIDQLLMDDSLTSDTPENDFPEIDALDAEPAPLTQTDPSEQHKEVEVNTKANKADDDDNNNNHEADEFSEIDEYTEGSDLTATDKQSNTLKNTSDAPEEGDDFLLSDFNTSSDEDELTDSTNSEHLESRIEQPIESPQPAATKKEITQENITLNEINAKISRVWAEHEDLTRKITPLLNTARPDSSNSDDIHVLKTEQHKLNKSLKNNIDNAPLMTYIALGIAIIAFLVGSGLGLIVYSAQTKVSALAEQVKSLEEGVDLLLEQNSSQQMQHQLDLLSSSISNLDTALKDTAQKAIVDDLVLQNDHTQQAIELLLFKVATLENHKIAAARAKRIQKTTPKVLWVVNLISFKQEWYAQRKAAEFNKKGIPAEAIQVEVNGQTWFRLTVKNFKSKSEAAAYAVKVKKILNLSSAWISKA